MAQLKDLIEVAKTRETQPLSIDGWDESELIEGLGIHNSGCYYSDPKGRLRHNHISRWMCTDTPVGLDAVFLDGELIAITHQPYRKSNKEWQFVDEKSALMLKNYLLSLTPEEPMSFATLSDEALSKDMGEGYHLSFEGQQMCNHAIYEGDKVELLRKPINYHNTKEVEIVLASGEHKMVDIETLCFTYNTL